MITVTIKPDQVERLKGALEAVQAKTLPTVLKTIRKALWVYTVDDTKRAIASGSGIGRRIWGDNPSGLDRQGLVGPGKMGIGEGEGFTTFVLRGIPALLEGGGPIKPHQIRRPWGNKGKGGKELRKPRPRMQHPGMTLRAHRFGLRELDADEAQIKAYVDEAVGEMLRRNGF
jgi:hypothetical protein